MEHNLAVHVTTCPIATIHAPAEVVWRLLTDPDEYLHWGLNVVAVDPPGPVHAGQRIELRERSLGRAFPVTLEIREVRETPHRSLRLDARLAFGIVNRELITCAALGPESSFVSFN
jgi:hypothetical protein